MYKKSIIYAIFSYFSVLLPTVINSLTISRYPSVLERVLGIHPVFAQRQSIRQVSFEFMTRELLWHGFAVSIFRLWPYTKILKISLTDMQNMSILFA